jgi:hypothetical protein
MSGPSAAMEAKLFRLRYIIQVVLLLTQRAISILLKPEIRVLPAVILEGSGKSLPPD